MTTSTVTTRTLLDSMHQSAKEQSIDILVNEYAYAQETAIKLVTEIDGIDLELDSNSAF
jgi:hypothetical protein